MGYRKECNYEKCEKKSKNAGNKGKFNGIPFFKPDTYFLYIIYRNTTFYDNFCISSSISAY